MTTIPTSLNGYPVIRSNAHANCATVMMHRASDPIPYVVATWWTDLGSTWSWGHYCATEAEAKAEFASADSRNARR